MIQQACSSAAREALSENARKGDMSLLLRGSAKSRLEDYEDWIQTYVAWKTYDKLRSLGRTGEYQRMQGGNEAQREAYLERVIPDYARFLRETVEEAVRELCGSKCASGYRS